MWIFLTCHLRVTCCEPYICCYLSDLISFWPRTDVDHSCTFGRAVLAVFYDHSLFVLFPQLLSWCTPIDLHSISDIVQYCIFCVHIWRHPWTVYVFIPLLHCYTLSAIRCSIFWQPFQLYICLLPQVSQPNCPKSYCGSMVQWSYTVQPPWNS